MFPEVTLFCIHSRSSFHTKNELRDRCNYLSYAPKQCLQVCYRRQTYELEGFPENGFSSPLLILLGGNLPLPTHTRKRYPYVFFTVPSALQRAADVWLKVGGPRAPAGAVGRHAQR